MILVEWTGKAYGTNRRLEVNRYGKVYKNPGYRAFQKGLTWLLVKERTIHGPVGNGDVMVRIELWINSQRDIDSLVKQILDCLEKAQVIENDRQVKHLTVLKYKKEALRGADKIRVMVDGIRN